MTINDSEPTSNFTHNLNGNPLNRYMAFKPTVKMYVINARFKLENGLIVKKRYERRKMVIRARFERATYGLEGSCSIQLSYRTT